ncbi:ATP synthase F0 subunit C [Helicobacter sp. 13S00401-1]|uniref:F0F1 ATP synthase subunit C n=1 Tax=unclassified Helicobacter TaxID=2593540 RepID=UPI000BA58D9C|nr:MULTISPECIES: F0F1 ATP synthase subunit C [unclassified Helicobacter]PAF45870.1 ATP synthase F0 subunit C [Helicobacter sp. 11S02629-2]PAF50257.1 ATP synthase F0 subunit C [Helicobacter sp. 13S00401-1]
MKLLFTVLAITGFAFAGEIGGKEFIQAFSVVGAVVGLGIAALGGGIGMGHAAAAAITGTARNPALGSKLQATMFIAIALIEAQVIYTLVFAIIALYANPFL